MAGELLVNPISFLPSFLPGYVIRWNAGMMVFNTRRFWWSNTKRPRRIDDKHSNLVRSLVPHEVLGDLAFLSRDTQHTYRAVYHNDWDWSIVFILVPLEYVIEAWQTVQSGMVTQLRIVFDIYVETILENSQASISVLVGHSDQYNDAFMLFPASGLKRSLR